MKMKCKNYILILSIITVIFSDDKFILCQGEISFIENLKGDIDRNNIYSFFKLNENKGDLFILRSSFGTEKIEENWIKIKKPLSSSGKYELISAELSVISKITKNDIEKSNIYSAVLINNNTGESLVFTPKNYYNFTETDWIVVPRPDGEKDNNGNWNLSFSEHSIVTFQKKGFDRENLYSVFTINQKTGETFRLELTIDFKKGEIIGIWKKIRN